MNSFNKLVLRIHSVSENRTLNKTNKNSCAREVNIPLGLHSASAITNSLNGDSQPCLFILKSV